MSSQFIGEGLVLGERGLFPQGKEEKTVGGMFLIRDLC